MAYSSNNGGKPQNVPQRKRYQQKTQKYSEKYGSNRPNPYTGYLPPGTHPGGIYRPDAIDSRRNEAQPNIAPPPAVNTPQQTVYHGPRYDSEEGFVNDWMHVDGEEISLLLEKYPLPLNKAFHIDEWTSLRKYYNSLLSEYNEKTADSLDMIDCIMTQMIITMHRAYKKQNVLTKTLDQISFVRQEIIKNPAKKWTLRKMAEMSGYSVSRFSELYRKAYNISPVNDVIEQRISSAKKLLLSGQVSVSQVADMCGFNSINYFSKFFKASTGYAPSEYIMIVDR